MKNRKKKKIDWKHWIPFYIMGIPGFIYLIINNYLPLAGLQIAFKKYNYRDGMWGSQWNNFDNFEYLFSSEWRWFSCRRTLKCLNHKPPKLLQS